MICLGVDPDTFNTGIALVDTHACSAPEVLYATTVATDPKREMDWRLIMQVKGVADALRDIRRAYGGVSRIAVETMRHYTHKSQVRPQDLIHLNEVAGAALGAARVLWPSARIWDPKPQAWKGTIAKITHQRRTLRQVGLTAKLTGVPGMCGLTMIQKGHVVDAIGLALKVATHHFPASLT